MDTDPPSPAASPPWVVTSVVPTGRQLFTVTIVDPLGLIHQVVLAENFLTLTNVRLVSNVVSMLWRDSVGASPLALER